MAYRITFDRIGRHENPPPLELDPVAQSAYGDAGNQMARSLHNYAREYLTSRSIETSVDLGRVTATIIAGLRIVGEGTVEWFDPDVPTTWHRTALPGVYETEDCRFSAERQRRGWLLVDQWRHRHDSQRDHVVATLAEAKRAAEGLVAAKGS